MNIPNRQDSGLWRHALVNSYTSLFQAHILASFAHFMISSSAGDLRSLSVVTSRGADATRRPGAAC